MLIALTVIAAIIIFHNKSVPPVSKTTSNTGGTSTPIPETNTPQFYQESNSANVNLTKSVDNKPNNLLQVNKSLKTLYPTVASNPIPIESITDTEQTSVDRETNISYANNGIGKVSLAVEEYPAPARFPISDLIRKVTYNSPSSVPHNNIAYYHEQAASIAPNPPSNPKIETVVPKIASKIVTPVKVVTPTLARSTFFNRSL